MLRRFIAVAGVLVLFTGIALAKDHKGTLVKVDIEDKKITVKIGDDEKSFKIDDKTEWLRAGKTDKITPIASEKLPDFAKLVEKAAKGRGVQCQISTDEDDKVVKKVTVMGVPPKGKDKSKDKDK